MPESYIVQLDGQFRRVGVLGAGPISSQELVLKQSAESRGKKLVKKDVVYPDTWHIPDETGNLVEWTCTPEMIAAIAANYQKYLDAGYQSEVLLNHTEAAEKIYGHVVCLSVDSANRLWAYFEVLPEDVADIKRVGKCSAKFQTNYQTQYGETLSIHMVHLGFVFNPVVGKQGEVIELSAKSGKRKLPVSGKPMHSELDLFHLVQWAWKTVL